MNEAYITILIDDLNGAEQGFRLSYGFAAVIEINNKKILFDTGTNVPPLLSNLKVCGISPSSIDAIILSHNHFDHTDGIPGILNENKNIPIYVHKYWNNPIRFKGISIPPKNLVINQEARECSEITEGIFLTNAYLSPDYGGIHEHACYIKSESSFILLTGCCHPGLIMFLNDREILGISLKKPLNIIGGLHSFKFTREKAKELEPLISSITLCHCTENIKIFKDQFGNKCNIGILGKKMKF